MVLGPEWEFLRLGEHGPDGIKSPRGSYSVLGEPCFNGTGGLEPRREMVDLQRSTIQINLTSVPVNLPLELRIYKNS